MAEVARNLIDERLIRALLGSPWRFLSKSPKSLGLGSAVRCGSEGLGNRGPGLETTTMDGWLKNKDTALNQVGGVWV